MIIITTSSLNSTLTFFSIILVPSSREAAKEPTNDERYETSMKHMNDRKIKIERDKSERCDELTGGCCNNAHAAVCIVVAMTVVKPLFTRSPELLMKGKLNEIVH